MRVEGFPGVEFDQPDPLQDFGGEPDAPVGNLYTRASRAKHHAHE